MAANQIQVPIQSDQTGEPPNPLSNYRNVFRDGDYLVVTNHISKYADRCLVCGSTEGCEKRMPFKIRKRTPITLIFFPVFYFLMYCSVTAIPLCKVHYRKERSLRRVGHVSLGIVVLGFVLPLVLLLIDDSFGSEVFALCGVALLSWYFWFYYQAFRRRYFYVSKFVGEKAYITGVSPEVLDAIHTGTDN